MPVLTPVMAMAAMNAVFERGRSSSRQMMTAAPIAAATLIASQTLTATSGSEPGQRGKGDDELGGFRLGAARAVAYRSPPVLHAIPLS